MCFKWWIVLMVLISRVHGQLNEKQLREASKLRDELKEKLDPEIKATPTQLAEIDAMRNEILNAVSKKEYKMALNNILPATAASAAKVKDPIVGSPLWNRIRYSQKHLTEFVAAAKPDAPAIPQNFKILGKFNMNSNSYRDVIDLTEVHENLKFDFDEPVLVWRTIPHSISGNSHLLLGLTNNSLVLGKLADGLFVFLDKLEITDQGLNLNGFEAFLHWNNKEAVLQGYAVLAVNNNLSWILLGEFNKLELTWSWPLHKRITKFKYYKFKNESMIFLGDDESGNLDIYRFSLDNKEFSQIENLRVPAPFNNIALIEWKKQLLMALPWQNQTTVYKYSERDQRFKMIKTIGSKGVTTVAGFQAGGLCFFAIGGDEPKILRYLNNGLKEIEVRRKTYQFVRAFVPIPIHTFRDDILLLVQFEVPFDTHTLSRIGSLRWNGEAFEAFFNVPCYMDEKLHYNGVNCLIDSDFSIGLQGTVVLTQSNNVSLLVPRMKTSSGLFDLKIEIRAAPHPQEEKLVDIQMLFDYFLGLKAHNNLVLGNAKDVIKNAVLPDKSEMVVTGNWMVDELDVQRLFPEGSLINKTEKMDESKNVTSEDILPALNNIVKDLVSLERTVERSVLRPEEGSEARNFEEDASLQLQKVRVNDIHFDTINGIPTDNVVWRLEDTLPFTGSLEVASVTVLSDFLGKVNGIDVNKDLVHAKQSMIKGKVNFNNVRVDTLSSRRGINNGLLESVSHHGNHFSSLRTKVLTVDDEFEVENINGINWRSFAQEIITTDLAPRNVSLFVGGNLIVEDDVEIGNLNDDPFADNYIWDTEGEDFIFVEGRKEFKASVVVNQIDMEGGLIDGVEQNRLISLAGGAYLPNETIFGDFVELVQGLIVPNSSDIEGPHMDKFLANPTLKDERLVAAACAFRNLRVEGNIILMGLLNNKDMNASLQEFLYKTEQPMYINVFKEFKHMQSNDVDTDLMNRRELDSYVTLNTDQTLLLNTLTGGGFVFDYLDLKGLFDFVNVTDMYESSIRTSGDQVTEAHIVLQTTEDGHSFHPHLSATAKNILIQDALNTQPAEAYIDSSNIDKYLGTIAGAEITIDRLYLSKNLNGAPIINGWNLDEYNLQRWSKTKMQTVTSPVIVQNLINSDFQLHRMNSKSNEELSAALSSLTGFNGDQFKSYKIDELHVQRGAKLDFINDEFMGRLLSNAIWLNQSNVLNSDFTCLEEILSEDTISLAGTFNGQKEFFKSVVWKDHGDEMRLKGRILFRAGAVVEGDIISRNINGIAVENILTKQVPVLRGDLTLKNNLAIHSQLIAPNWNLAKDFEARDLSKIYEYNSVTDTHEIVLDRVFFTAPAVIPHLIVTGALNDIPNIVDFLSGIQRVDSPKIILKVPKGNLKKFSFGTLQLDFVNGFSLEQFLLHAVLRSEGNSSKDVFGKVQFLNSVETSHINALDLSVDNINGLNSDLWFSDCILKTQPLMWEEHMRMSVDKFRISEITATHLNGVPFEKFDMKDRDQHLSGAAYIQEMIIDGHVGVMGSVNGLKLKPEKKNSLLTFSPTVQIVQTRSTFHDIRVMNSLTIEGFVNGKNFSHIIPINGQDVTIESPVSFAHLQNQHFHTGHILNGMDFNAWYGDSVKYMDSDLQIIKGYWHINKLVVKQSMTGTDSINGESLTNLINAHTTNRPQLERYESELQFAYWKMCNQVRDYFTSPLRVGCSFKHFEETPIQMSLPSPASSLIVFRHLDEHFLIISSGCWTRLLLWNATEFKEIDLVPSGSVLQWTYVPSYSKQMHLIAKNNLNGCPNVYVNYIWTWDSLQGKLMPLKQLSGHAISDVLINPLKRNNFYAIIGAVVQEVAVSSGEVITEWSVHDVSGTLRFLPCAYDSLELSVTNGTNTHTIKLKPTSRFKRHWLKFGTRSKRVEEKYKFFTEYMFMNRSSFMQLAKEAILNKKITAVKKILSTIAPNHDKEDKAFQDEVDNVATTANPNVGDALFDDIQNRIKDGAELFMDSSADVLEYVDSKYDVEEILDALEEGLLSSPKPDEKLETPVVGGALFDDMQNAIMEGADLFVDTSADLLEDIDDIVDVDEVLGNSGGDLQGQLFEGHVRNQSTMSHPLDSARSYSPNSFSGNGEVVALHVGAGRQIRTLFGVLNSISADQIFIYEDLHGGRPFQMISCSSPSSLTSSNMDQETLLIFLENRVTVQVYVFRGMMGFVHYLHVNLPSPVDYIRTAVLPWAPCGCRSHFLVVASKKYLRFLKAQSVGSCFSEIIECNDY